MVRHERLSEAAAKLAGEGTWPHKLRPRLGTRQHGLGRGCEGEKLTTYSVSRDGRRARTPGRLALPRQPPPQLFVFCEPLGTRRAASALTPGPAQISMPADELEARWPSHLQSLQSQVPHVTTGTMPFHPLGEPRFLLELEIPGGGCAPPQRHHFRINHMSS